MNLKYVCCGLLYYLHYQVQQCYSKSITYFNTERPMIYWYDRRYFKNCTILSRRVSQQDPKHYVDIYIEMLIPLNNSITLDYYFYQFLTNRYRPSFVELHFKLCDLVNFDTFLGETLRNALGGGLCPYPPGVHHLKNMSVPYVPKSFPFAKGRIYLNVSLTSGGVTKIIGSASMDMEIKVATIRNN